MEQRDYLQAQIEQLGKVLGKILANFLDLKEQGETSAAIEIANEQLHTKLDIDIEKILQLRDNALAEYLQKRKLNWQLIEHLIDYFYQLGTFTFTENKSKARKYLEKAMELYQIIDNTTGIYSFERIQKEENIISLINKCKDTDH